ncbi:MAG: hypothetical protein CVU05_06390 [Bacteroidetes bacterium HGW-Bacteroidetes-21]|jgi:hypothetical protein|nr:MAG: hypothetical protein CVU05_06390 [Bacteroidetes bacterium HGW-Bacteroidetes-21]
MANPKAKDLIISLLEDKSQTKVKVINQLDSAFKVLLSSCKLLCKDLKDKLKGKESALLLDCYDRNSNSFELRFGDESLVFQKIPIVLQIDKSHSMWTTSYLTDNYQNSYCGIINVYNFLSDSFRNNRLEERGYLIARIFVNHENHFFVEGKRQLGFLYNDFSSAELKADDLYKICESAMLYCMDFDPQVPDYDAASAISVGELKDQIDYFISPSQKKLGFKFYTDD